MSRQERIGELIRDEVSLILRKKINDPRVGFASITRVDVTDDIKHAKIFVSVYGSDEEKRATMEGLQSAKGFIRALLASALDVRAVPEISFNLDSSIEKASRVFEIMRALEQEKASHGKKPDIKAHKKRARAR
jgi:ribosome-binding factor A